MGKSPRVWLLAGVGVLVGFVPTVAPGPPTPGRYSPGAYFTIKYPGATATDASGINKFGQIVGYYTDAHGISHGFVDVAGKFRTFNDPDAGTKSGQGTQGSGINDSGTIVGGFSDARGLERGFVDVAGKFTTLNGPTIGGGTSYAYANFINDAGTVSGIYGTRDGTSYGFTYRDGRYTTLVDPHAREAPPVTTLVPWWVSSGTAGLGINSAGVIVGTYSDANGVLHGFIDVAGRFTTFDGRNAGKRMDEGTDLFGISDSRVMVGSVVLARGAARGFVDVAGRITPINDPYAGRGPDEGTLPTDVNAIGVIVGTYYTVGGGALGFELTPHWSL